MEEINKLRVFRERSGKRYSYYIKSIIGGFRGFSEKIAKRGNDEYREVRPDRSKFVAAVANGLSQSGIREGSNVLYLGASHGYTPSFISDIVGESGAVICVEVAQRSMRDLVFLCEKRMNMLPIMEDANHPERYREIGNIDVVYQDIAQRNQLEIFLKNCDMFLKPGGFGLLALKARSIDVSRKPKEIFLSTRKELEKRMSIVDYRELEPHEMDHAFFVVKKK